MPSTRKEEGYKEWEKEKAEMEKQWEEERASLKSQHNALMQ